MNRKTITLTDREDQELEDTRVWYEEITGVRVSMNSLMRKLLFSNLDKFRDNTANP